MISNAAISKILRQIAYLIELEETKYNHKDNKNKVNTVFKIRSYRRTADIIENLSSNVEEIYDKWKLKGLTEIPSVGKAIA
jgi:DNA polymerase (family X)